MPGYKIHDAVGNPEMMGNLAYRKGLNAPDFFKRINSKEEFEKYFEGCNQNEIPSYEEFLTLKEIGFHLAKHSSDSNIEKFLNLQFVNLSKAFWEGYLIHLITDKEMYDEKNKCVDMEKYKVEGRNREILHRDWDITNSVLDEKFKIELLPEIKETGKVHYISGEKPIYINLKRIIEHIYTIREIGSNCKKLNEYISSL